MAGKPPTPVEMSPLKATCQGPASTTARLLVEAVDVVAGHADVAAELVQATRRFCCEFISWRRASEERFSPISTCKATDHDGADSRPINHLHEGETGPSAALGAPMVHMVSFPLLERQLAALAITE